MAAIKERIEITNKKKVDVSVYSTFYNKEKDTYLYVVIFGKSNKFFYMKPEHYRQIIEIVHEREMIGNVNRPLEWLSTIDTVKIGKKEYGEESLFHRTAKNNTSEQIMYVVTVSSKNQNNAFAIIKECTDYFFKVMASRKYNIAEKLALHVKSCSFACYPKVDKIGTRLKN